MSITHRRDYEELGLDEGADYAAARAAYRRLVNVWHPDRYANRPRERDHAQQRFIGLTRSFDRLRAFHREHRRLPFETVVPRAPETLRGDRAERLDTERRRRSEPAVAVDVELSGDELLGTGGRARAPSRGPRRPALAWLGAGAAIAAVALAVVALVVLDRHERQETWRDGRDVLLETEPSEFMPSATEVRHRSTRGTFVTREDGELGDRLMEDLFDRP